MPWNFAEFVAHLFRGEDLLANCEENPGSEDPGYNRLQNYCAASALARICCQRRGRFFMSRIFLRRGMDFGVTSTNSSSAMNSIALSRLSCRCGIRRMASLSHDVPMF